VDVASELPELRLAPHRGDDLVADHERPHVLALRLADEFLDDDVLLHRPKGLEHGLEALEALREHDADALRALGELGDDGDPAAQLDGKRELFGVPKEHGAGGVDAVARKELGRAQLVAGACDRLGTVHDGRTHHLELVHDGKPVGRDARPDAWDDNVGAREPLAFVVHERLFVVDRNLALEWVEDAKIMAQLLGLFREAARRV